MLNVIFMTTENSAITFHWHIDSIFCFIPFRFISRNRNANAYTSKSFIFGASLFSITGQSRWHKVLSIMRIPSCFVSSLEQFQ